MTASIVATDEVVGQTAAAPAALDLAGPDTADLGMVDPDMVDPDMVDLGMVDPDMVDLGMVVPDMADLAGPDLVALDTADLVVPAESTTSAKAPTSDPIITA